MSLSAWCVSLLCPRGGDCRYVTTQDRIYLVLEIILVVIIGYYIIDEGREIFEQRLDYFKDVSRRLLRIP